MQWSVEAKSKIRNTFGSTRRRVASLLALVAASATAAELPPGLEQWFAGYASHARLVRLPDGRSLNLYCIGKGSPTVIFESGLTESSYSWWAVQPEIAKVTRACTYDRAGMGMSPAGPLPRDTKAQVKDLEALVKAAHLQAPYVLVGHSAGGFSTRVFATRHLRDMAGLVLVDPSVENQIPIMESISPAIAENDKKQNSRIRACADPSRSEHVADLCTRKPPQPFSPELDAKFRSMFGLRHAETVMSEGESFVSRDSDQVIAERKNLGNLPLIVLTRGALDTDLPPDQAAKQAELLKNMHDNVARLSSAGVNRTIADSGHYIQLAKPQAVIDAISEVIRTARTKGRKKSNR